MTTPLPFRSGSPGARVTLRRFLLGIVMLGMSYVAIIGLVLAFRIAPDARLLRHDTSVLLAEHDLISARLADQRAAVNEIRLMVAGTPSARSAAALTEDVRARLDSVLAMDASSRIRLPDDVRLALARATESETRLGEVLLQALASAQVGNPLAARQRLAAAEVALDAAEGELAAAQRMALADMVRREDTLTDVAVSAARSVLFWLALGAAGVLLAALIMRRMFFAPLEELETGLSRVAAGDLTVSVPVHRPDEIGRLAGHLNAMTEVLRSAGQQEIERRERLRSALSTFWTAQSSVVLGVDLQAALQAVTSTAAPAIDVERASVWLFDEKRPVARCVDLFERGTGRHSDGEEVTAPDHPLYFGAITSARTVAADDAVRDPRTRGFASGYLEPLGITSSLDAGIYFRGRLAGLLCFEHVGPQRRWRDDEQSFANSVADFVSLILEAAERSRAEQALRRSEERYRAAFTQAAVGLVETDLAGVIVQANPRFCSLLGYAEADLLGRSLVGLGEAEGRTERALAIRRLATDEIAFHESEQRLRRNDGAPLWVRVTMAPVRSDGLPQFLLAVVENLTERRTLEAQLVRAQKMESIGRLAGGVAHDFNNLLTAIIGYAEGARAAATDPELATDLDEVLRAAGRGAELTRQLLTFARNHVVEPRILDVNDLVRGMDKLLRRLIGEHIDFTAELAEDIGTVRADPAQLEQVVVNLVVNARDAMPSGGRLVIETGRFVVEGDDTVPRRLDAPPGEYLQIAVSDTGVGMDEGIQARLFEPFFTTKDPDKGTGLGLAICYGIVKQAGGFIHVYSEVGRGSTFRVCLPRLAGRVTPVSVPDVASSEARGTETVLIAEDDPQIRRLGVRALKAQGYQVFDAGDGEQAITRAAEIAGPIHLLVTDVVLPRLAGPELAGRLRALRPELRVIFISGYTRGAMNLTEGLDGDHRFLSKPFTPRQLVRLVRETLDAT